MKISCPACSAKYSIADDKVQERLAKIRCRKCGATIVIDGKSTPPNVYTAAGEAADAQAAPAEAGQEYSVDFGEGDQRNMSVRDIARAYGAGQITGETYVWAEGFADWTQLSEVSELMSAVSGGGSRAPSAPAPSPWDAKPTAARTSALPRTTTASRAAARPAADLFGGVSRAGNEDDVATSAPEQPSAAGGPGTGQRNESSVLFSLSALTSAAQNQRPSARPPAVGGGRDDSGLIDLKALTAAAVKSDTGGMAMPAVPAVAPLASPLGVASPLGYGSPLGAGVSTGAEFGQKKSKTPLIIAALLSVGMLAVAAAIVLRPPPPPPPAPVVAVTPPPPAPAPTPEPIAAAPPATGTAEATPAPEASAKPATGGARRPAARRPSSSTSTTTSTKKEDAKPAAAAPKSSNCGCGPADLQCAMRCASKKK